MVTGICVVAALLALIAWGLKEERSHRRAQRNSWNRHVRHIATKQEHEDSQQPWHH